MRFEWLRTTLQWSLIWRDRDISLPPLCPRCPYFRIIPIYKEMQLTILVKHFPGRADNLQAAPAGYDRTASISLDLFASFLNSQLSTFVSPCQTKWLGPWTQGSTEVSGVFLLPLSDSATVAATTLVFGALVVSGGSSSGSPTKSKCLSLESAPDVTFTHGHDFRSPSSDRLFFGYVSSHRPIN